MCVHGTVVCRICQKPTGHHLIKPCNDMIQALVGGGVPDPRGPDGLISPYVTNQLAQAPACPTKGEPFMVPSSAPCGRGECAPVHHAGEQQLVHQAGEEAGEQAGEQAGDQQPVAVGESMAIADTRNGTGTHSGIGAHIGMMAGYNGMAGYGAMAHQLDYQAQLAMLQRQFFTGGQPFVGPVSKLPSFGNHRCGRC